MMLANVLRALLLLFAFAATAGTALPVFAQDASSASPKTDPFALPHPQTLEPGVWIPLWLQQEFLKTDAALHTCTEERAAVRLQLTEKALEVRAVYAASTELQTGLEALKTRAALDRTFAKQADARASRRLYWALGSTGAATVAVLIIVLQNL